jgi:hypothetical protein
MADEQNGQAPQQPAYPQIGIQVTPDGKATVLLVIFGNGFSIQQAIADETMDTICSAHITRRKQQRKQHELVTAVKRDLKRND